MKINIHSINGSDTGRSMELPEEVFGVEENGHLLYLAVKQYHNNQRQGTHKAKERGEVVGSTRKIKKQKGTGTARAGSIKNPLFKGGGRVFGPRPRDYSIDLNKKVSRLARCVALSHKAREGQIMIVEDFTFDAPKTKEMISVLTNLNAKRPLIVTADYDKNVYKSGKNLPKTVVRRASDINVYEILNSGSLILAESAVEKIKEQFA